MRSVHMTENYDLKSIDSGLTERNLWIIDERYFWMEFERLGNCFLLSWKVEARCSTNLENEVFSKKIVQRKGTLFHHLKKKIETGKNKKKVLGRKEKLLKMKRERENFMEYLEFLFTFFLSQKEGLFYEKKKFFQEKWMGSENATKKSLPSLKQKMWNSSIKWKTHPFETHFFWIFFLVRKDSQKNSYKWRSQEIEFSENQNYLQRI